MNPPFSMLCAVLWRLQSVGCFILLVWPEWSPAHPALCTLALRTLRLPRGEPLFARHGRVSLAVDHGDPKGDPGSLRRLHTSGGRGPFPHAVLAALLDMMSGGGKHHTPTRAGV